MTIRLAILILLIKSAVIARGAQSFPVVVIGKEVYNMYEMEGARFVRISDEQVDKIIQTDPKNPLGLFVAATRGDAALTKELLAEGANPNHKTDFGHYPIHEAARGGYLEVLELLLAAGAKVDVRVSPNGPHTPNQWTALHFAAYGGHLEVAKRLIAKGANVNVRDYWRKTPLFYATKQNHEDVARILKQSGAAE